MVAGVYDILFGMRRCRINLSNRRYRLIGRVIAQRGATYPVDYSYDEFGEKIAMTTYRNAGGPGFVPAASAATGGPGFVPAAGDTTRWLRDEATGLVTNKVYADGKGPTYTYTPDGKLATRTWARGIVTTYSYDANGALTNTVYSDGMPTISLVYNRAGRQIEAHDAAGVTTFLYDDFGAVTNETVLGVAGTNTIERFYDDFGRDAGYALNGVRQSALAYDPATGRLATMLADGSDTPFTWDYLAGSDLKSSLAYPNGLTASWTYDPNNQLLQVRNVTPTNTISQYDYMYDSAGRRITVSKSGTAFDHDDSIAYGYNARSELTNAVAAVDTNYRYTYDFDDIGNRKNSSERGTNTVYAANNLNQYNAVDDFTPQFDDDGNQTLIKTSTGIWSVTYNGENRPILWTCTQSDNLSITNNQTISMSFDRMGRRVTKNDQRFIYDGYLQIANFEQSVTNSQLTPHNLQLFIWDPTEPVATRPLLWLRDTSVEYYTHDGNKNVGEVVSSRGEIMAHYEYTSFGAVSIIHGESASVNPWRFSSVYAEDDSSTRYYNYRHYESVTGRWLSRDPISESGGGNIYAFCSNNSRLDILGLGGIDDYGGFIDAVWPTPSGGWQAVAEQQRLERERKETESAMPDIRAGLNVDVSGGRNFPLGGAWGITVKVSVSKTAGTCCDKETKARRQYEKLTASITVSVYGGAKPLIEIPDPEPALIVALAACPDPDPGSYDGAFVVDIDAGGPSVSCSYSFTKGTWECDAGFKLKAITKVSLSVGGQISYEQVKVY